MDQEICKIINDIVFFNNQCVFANLQRIQYIYIPKFYSVELNLVLLVSLNNCYTFNRCFDKSSSSLSRV